MEEWFAQVMEVTCMLSPVILLLLGLGPLLRRVYTAGWRVWVWLLLAVRLAVPLNFSLPAAPVVLPAPESPAFSAPLEAVPAPPQTAPEGAPSPSGSPAEREDAAPPGRTVSGSALLALLWAAGAAVCAGYQLFCYLSLWRAVRRWSEPVQEPEIGALFRQLCGELGARRVRLLRCRKVDSPMLIGFFRPMVLLPAQRWDLEDTQMILRHELTHHRRRDLWFRLLLLAARTVHWFNPLVYLMERAAVGDMEIACDSQVVHGRDLEYRRLYSESILGAIHAQRSRGTALSTRFLGGKRTLKNRFAAILDTRAKRRGVLAFLLAAGLVASASLLAVWGAPAPAEWEISTQQGEDASAALRLAVTTPQGEMVPLVSDREYAPDVFTLSEAATAAGVSRAQAGSREQYRFTFAQPPQGVYVRYLGPDAWQEAYPYYDEALQMPDDAGTYTFFVDVAFAPEDTETFCFVVQVGEEGETPVPLAGPHVAGEGMVALADGRSVTLQITLMNGSYYKPPEDMHGGGIYPENYQGSYYARVFGEKGVEESLLYSDPIFVEGVEMNFPAGVFPIYFDDYNGDGDPDFTLGQYGSSSMNQFRLFTIRQDGRVEQLPWEVGAIATQDFSVLLEKPAPGEITLPGYHNGYGAYLVYTLRWDAATERFVQAAVALRPAHLLPPSQEATVPELRGRRFAQAADILLQAGFGFEWEGSDRKLFDETATVATQDPPAGTKLEPGELVRLTAAPS